MIGGRFIVVEGIDGAGSTTLASRLAEQWRSERRPVHQTCEPSSGPIGALIRQVLSRRLVTPTEFGAVPLGWAEMALLFAADRIDHLESEILPLLRDGITVVCDRYDLSSLTYQVATATPGASDEMEQVVGWVRELNRRARRPDFTIVLDVDPEVAARRRRARGFGKELYEDVELQTRLAAAYANAESLVIGDRLVHIDGNGSVESVVVAATQELHKLDAP